MLTDTGHYAKSWLMVSAGFTLAPCTVINFSLYSSFETTQHDKRERHPAL